ncbi:MAG: alkaline phosphatase family protein [Candidatus Omnitrophica bacterium]|nr:alkaline phosphatase family protein [Candidatus Omnitrophota bacterium]
MFDNSRRRTFVLGLDGVPYSFLKQAFAKGQMPHLAKMAGQAGLKKINSVYPTISSVAWTSYMTGVNPAEHNIFGFVNRNADPFRITIPTAQDRKAETIWSALSRQGKRVIVINVPLTYPPEEVNGILASGFLCTDIEKCAYPASFNRYLKEKDYIIDVDAWLARSNKKEEFMQQLHQAMEKRFQLAWELIEKEKWDFFQLHIMETDRLFHFFWNDVENQSEFSAPANSFFEKLDLFIHKLQERLSGNDRLLILSDHGFCAVKSEVQLNAWLEEQGFLRFEDNVEKKLPNYSKESLCYSLIPGRIFINLQGREQKGSVSKNDYQKLRLEIKEKLLEFNDPNNGEKVIEKVFFREEIYKGPYLEQAADIIAHPVDGYDLKGKVGAKAVFEMSELNGMHTYDDAFALGINLGLDSIDSIQDFKKIIH